MEKNKTNIFEILRCPVCSEPFEMRERAFVCKGEKPHCFDVASSGYVNLLPPGKSKNAHTGDDKGMISARVEFLGKGYYAPISKSIGEMIVRICNEQGISRINLVDSGCGEGYHTVNIIKTIAENDISVTAAGFDASKYGAAAASKRSRREKLAFDRMSEDTGAENISEVFFGAGNIFSLPIKDESIDFTVSMFAPIAAEENYRVLKNTGRLIVAASGKEHLYELRRALYDEPRQSSGEIRIPEGFEKESEEHLTYKVSLDSREAIYSLFEMTPFYYRTSEKDKNKLSVLDFLEITVDVVFCICRKTS